jgi:hypothetical protein
MCTPIVYLNVCLSTQAAHLVRRRVCAVQACVRASHWHPRGGAPTDGRRLLCRGFEDKELPLLVHARRLAEKAAQKRSARLGAGSVTIAEDAAPADEDSDDDNVAVPSGREVRTECSDLLTCWRSVSDQEHGALGHA